MTDLSIVNADESTMMPNYSSTSTSVSISNYNRTTFSDIDNEIDSTGNENSQLMQQLNDTGIFVALISAGLALFVVFCSYYYTKYEKQRVSDSANYWSILRFFQNAGDIWTDVLFNFILYLEFKKAANDNDEAKIFGLLWIISCGSIILPFLMSCVVAVIFTIQWLRWTESNPSRLHKYLERYLLVVYSFTIVSGFYSAISMLRTKLFYNKMFYFPLKRSEISRLNGIRFINIVVLENIPQIFVQIMYAFGRNSNTKSINSIVYISMTFSILGIIFSFMHNISHVYECFNPKYKRFTHTTIVDGQFTIYSKKLRGAHSFGYHKINKCIHCLFSSSKITCVAISILKNSINNVQEDELIIKGLQHAQHMHRHANRLKPKMDGNTITIAANTGSNVTYSNWLQRDDIVWSLETYYIEDNIYVSNKMTVHFELKISHFNTFPINDLIFQTVQAIDIEESQQLEMFVASIRRMLKITETEFLEIEKSQDCRRISIEIITQKIDNN